MIALSLCACDYTAWPDELPLLAPSAVYPQVDRDELQPPQPNEWSGPPAVERVRALTLPNASAETLSFARYLEGFAEDWNDSFKDALLKHGDQGLGLWVIWSHCMDVQVAYVQLDNQRPRFGSAESVARVFNANHGEGAYHLNSARFSQHLEEAKFVWLNSEQPSSNYLFGELPSKRLFVVRSLRANVKYFERQRPHSHVVGMTHLAYAADRYITHFANSEFSFFFGRVRGTWRLIAIDTG
ncbi:MAG: hypothetical protein AB7K71_39610 [Polyangiaceae bacterium]